METLIKRDEDYFLVFSCYNEEKIMGLDFFVVDKKYIDHLQNEEIKIRGFTRVPNMHYPDGKQKLVCGIILHINGLKYYVGLTSYKVQRSENILIVTKDKKDPVKGSLRFNYMFPVPDNSLAEKKISDETDLGYKSLLTKEYQFIKSNEQLIMYKAKNIYEIITTGTASHNLLNNSCDFKVLEKACRAYEVKKETN